MKGSDFKKWMEKNQKSVADVASALKVHPNTVTNFVNGKSVQLRTRLAFEELVAETPEPQKKVG